MAVIDGKIIKFLIVGVVNTLFGAAIMFGLYNLVGCSYWLSSAANYFFGSILSFFLNKSFTFGNKDSLRNTVPKFVLNILICYLLAYGLAKPAVLYLLEGSPRPYRRILPCLWGCVCLQGLTILDSVILLLKRHKGEKLCVLKNNSNLLYTEKFV